MIRTGSGFFHLLELRGQSWIELRIGTITLHEMQALLELGPRSFVVVASILGFRGSLVHLVTELLIGQFGATDSENVEVLVHASDTGKVKECRNELAAR
jgi:hypothetical protein